MTTREDLIKAVAHLQLKDRLLAEYNQIYAATLDVPVRQMSDAQLQDRLAVGEGLPLGTVLTDKQLEALMASWASELGSE
jgi:hypothetical protein